MELTVKKVRSFVRDEKASVCINDTIYLSQKQLESVGYNNPQALIGNKLTIEYYKTGDKLITGSECTKDNMIVKSFSIEASASDITLAKAANAGFRSFSMS